MIFAGYMGSVALVPTVKWLWFVIGLVVYIPVVIALVRIFRQCVLGNLIDIGEVEVTTHADKYDMDRIEL